MRPSRAANAAPPDASLLTAPDMERRSCDVVAAFVSNRYGLSTAAQSPMSFTMNEAVKAGSATAA